MTRSKTLPGVFRLLPLLLALVVNLAASQNSRGQHPETPHQTPHAKDSAVPPWSALSGARQQALAPLQGEWQALDTYRKKKWLAISDKFDTMTPEQQARSQSRMREWVALKPEQRRLARESYLQSKKLDPVQKTAKWERYEQLSDEEKQRLTAAAPQKKRITNLPSLHAAAGKPIRQAPAIPPDSAKALP